MGRPVLLQTYHMTSVLVVAVEQDIFTIRRYNIDFFWSTHSSKICGVKSISDYFSNGNVPNYPGIIEYSVNANFVTANDDYTLQT